MILSRSCHRVWHEPCHDEICGQIGRGGVEKNGNVERMGGTMREQRGKMNPLSTRHKKARARSISGALQPQKVRSTSGILPSLRYLYPCQRIR